MKILSRTGGLTEIQTEGRWSGAKQLWWRDAKVGDRLELALPVAKSGRYRLSMHNTAANVPALSWESSMTDHKSAWIRSVLR